MICECPSFSAHIFVIHGIGVLLKNHLPKNVKVALRQGCLLQCNLCNQPRTKIQCQGDYCP
jgi:hypothetical protein